MTARILRKPISGLSDDLLQGGFDMWQRHNGVLNPKDSHFDKLAPQVQVSFDADIWPPPFIYIGPQSTTAKVFGLDFTEDAAGQQGVPDRGFEFAVNQVYADVSVGREPLYDTVRALINPTGDHPMGIVYDRLVLPAEMRNGQRIFTVYTSFICKLQSVEQIDAQDR